MMRGFSTGRRTDGHDDERDDCVAKDRSGHERGDKGNEESEPGW